MCFIQIIFQYYLNNIVYNESALIFNTELIVYRVHVAEKRQDISNVFLTCLVAAWSEWQTRRDKQWLVPWSNTILGP